MSNVFLLQIRFNICSGSIKNNLYFYVHIIWLVLPAVSDSYGDWYDVITPYDCIPLTSRIA